MLKTLISSKLASEERRLGASLDYLRKILDTSLGAFFKFAKIMPLATYRKELPVEAYYVARLVATRDEDCGTCVQIEVNLARQEGVRREVVQAVLDRRVDDLDESLGTVYRFTEGVVEASGQEEELRPRLVELYGDQGLVELALAIASCRVFPVTKRALGYAKSCALVTVEV